MSTAAHDPFMAALGARRGVRRALALSISDPARELYDRQRDADELCALIAAGHLGPALEALRNASTLDQAGSPEHRLAQALLDDACARALARWAPGLANLCEGLGTATPALRVGQRASVSNLRLQHQRAGAFAQRAALDRWVDGAVCFAAGDALSELLWPRLNMREALRLLGLPWPAGWMSATVGPALLRDFVGERPEIDAAQAARRVARLRAQLQSYLEGAYPAQDERSDAQLRLDLDTRASARASFPASGAKRRADAPGAPC